MKAKSKKKRLKNVYPWGNTIVCFNRHKRTISCEGVTLTRKAIKKIQEIYKKGNNMIAIYNRPINEYSGWESSYHSGQVKLGCTYGTKREFNTIVKAFLSIK